MKWGLIGGGALCCGVCLDIELPKVIVQNLSRLVKCGGV